jgi:hypothetical protein
MDLSFVRPIADFRGEDEEDQGLCEELFRRASDYVTSFTWCQKVLESYVGECIGGVVALILFRIEPAKDDVDEWIWVVVGDLPSAYFGPAHPKPLDALADYLFEMRRWVSAAKAGEPVVGLIPVNVPPTPQWATELEHRLDFLERELIPDSS